MLVGCSEYSSQDQAMDACNEWEEQGEVIRYKLEGADGITYNESNRNRACYNSLWDNQVESYYGEFNDDDRAKEGKILKASELPMVKGRNKKYFRF